jgi:hypothetical protein
MTSIQFVFIVIIFLNFCMSRSLAQENQKNFDYTKTAWIINVIENSGVVYGRPLAEEYDTRQGFIYIYEILIKYVYSMEDFNSAISPNLPNVTHELILINGQAEQRLLIGDHWISDEKNIVVMNETDYKNLTEWLSARKANKDYKENPPIDKLVKAFKDHTSPTIESVDKYFHHNQTPSVPVKTQESTLSSPASVQKDIQISSEHKSSQFTNHYKTNATVKSQDSMNSSRFNMASSRYDSNANKTQPKNEPRKCSLFLWLIAFVASLFVLFFFRYWKKRKH